MTRSKIETIDPSTSSLALSLDTDLYSRDVLYAAAYVFLDRAYILLDRVGDRYAIHLRGKHPLDEDALKAIAGEFENELLAQALRERVGEANKHIIEGITALAISGATSPTAAPGVAAYRAPEFVNDPQGLGKPLHPEKGNGEK